MHNSECGGVRGDGARVRNGQQLSGLHGAHGMSLGGVLARNFHLTAASPATVRDVAGLTTCPGNDIDGEARPFNALCDLGADKFKP